MLKNRSGSDCKQPLKTIKEGDYLLLFKSSLFLRTFSLYIGGKNRLPIQSEGLI